MMKKRLIPLLLSAVLAVSSLCLLLPADTFAEELMALKEYAVIVDGTELPADTVIGAYTNGYDHRLYFSLRDLAAALNGTAGQYDFTLDAQQDSFVITTGRPYEIPEPVKLDPEPETIEGDYIDEEGRLRNRDDEIIQEPGWNLVQRPEYEYLQIYQNPLMIDGREVRYYTYQLSSLQDIYMDVQDLQPALDLAIGLKDADTIQITTGGYTIDLSAYADEGYFDLFNGVLLGDATTGEILFGCKENNMDAIASTSKLMTYLITARYLELGKIHMEDEVTLSRNVEDLAYSGYGTLYLDAGQIVTVHDLLGAMLLNSSNESALALAEYIAGSEERFVDMMNEMAKLLGLHSAKFCNSNGLPQYSDTLMASKLQNRMSCSDLFRLASVILRKYPQTPEFTAQKSMYLDTFGYTVWNTNSLLYNMPEVIGLKTGTTDEAGCCLVAAANVKKGSDDTGSGHTLIAIILGAESNIDRYQVPALLLTWGEQQLQLKSEQIGK